MSQVSLEISQPPPGDPGAAGPAADTGPAGPRADGADGPLLADAAALRATWQRLQTGFVDDPRAAVTDAAAFVEHTAQALAGALRQRQKRLREMWDDGADRADATDTEQLRLVMQRYRALFNQICRP